MLVKRGILDAAGNRKVIDKKGENVPLHVRAQVRAVGLQNTGCQLAA